jgi:esterase/lipase
MLFGILLGACVGACAHAGESVGIVLMHGKNGMPRGLQPLTSALQKAGYAVETPEMCWSRRRIYDLSYQDCLVEVDAVVERFKRAGATRIIVAGQSLGGNAALGYGATRKDISGIIAIAPAHNPLRLIKIPAIATDLEKARLMIEGGQEDTRASFEDMNHDGPFTVRATPKTYLTFFSPDGPAVLHRNVAAVHAPLLWISGTADPTQVNTEGLFARADNPKNRRVILAADHMGTPLVSGDAIISWLTR